MNMKTAYNWLDEIREFEAKCLTSTGHYAGPDLSSAKWGDYVPVNARYSAAAEYSYLQRALKMALRK